MANLLLLLQSIQPDNNGDQKWVSHAQYGTNTWEGQLASW